MIRRHLKTFLYALLSLTAFSAASAQSRPADALARTPVTWLIFVDDLHLQFRNTGRIRDALKAIARHLIQEGDSFAIASSGPSALAVDLTTDRQELDAAIKKATGNGLKYEDIRTASDSAEVRYRVSTALATAQSILDNLPRAPSRPTALLYISNGYSFELLPDHTPGSRPLGRFIDPTKAAIREQLADLAATVKRTNVRVFAIDFLSTDLDAGPPDAEEQAHLDEMQRSLRSMSDSSGGFTRFSQDWVAQLQRVADAMQR